MCLDPATLGPSVKQKWFIYLALALSVRVCVVSDGNFTAGFPLRWGAEGEQGYYR